VQFVISESFGAHVHSEKSKVLLCSIYILCLVFYIGCVNMFSCISKFASCMLTLKTVIVNQ